MVFTAFFAPRLEAIVSFYYPKFGYGFIYMALCTDFKLNGRERLRVFLSELVEQVSGDHSFPPGCCLTHVSASILHPVHQDSTLVLKARHHFRSGSYAGQSPHLPFILSAPP